MTRDHNVNVQILDREFKISCAEHEKSNVLASAKYLNDRLREIKSHSNVITTDRLVLLAALNMANDYLNLQLKLDGYEKSLSKITSLQEKLDSALADI